METHIIHAYTSIQSFQSSKRVISEYAIAHLTLFSSVHLGAVALMALAPKYCSTNTAIDVLASKWLLLNIVRFSLLGC